MTMHLAVTDGTLTVALTDGITWPKDYRPLTPRGDRATVDETAEMHFETIAIGRDKIRDLNRLFVQAARYHRTRQGSKVYVEHQPELGEMMYRSLLYGGRVDLDERTYHELWGADVMEADITWTRATYWEGELTQIPLTNGSATRTLANLTCYNHDDADSGHDNWANIDGLDVEGDLPTPLRLEITNNTDSGVSTGEMRTVYVAMGVHNDPLNFVHMVEMEDETQIATKTIVVDAGASGGEYGEYEWTDAGMTDLVKIQISNTVMSQAQGAYFRVLVRLHSDPPAGCRYQLSLWDTDNLTIWDGPIIYGVDGDQLLDFGTVPLPPALIGSGLDMGEMFLVLSADANASGTHTLDMDWLQLTPLDGWRAHDSEASIPAGEGLFDDGIEGYAYHYDGSYGYNLPPARGHAIHLLPGQDARLYVLQMGESGLAQILRSVALKAYYRPRRVTL
jgi:hypothetical protein